jgi:hypothetical protein
MWAARVPDIASLIAGYAVLRSYMQQKAKPKKRA